MLRDSVLHLLDANGEVFNLAGVGSAVLVYVVKADVGVSDGAFAKLVQLMAPMEVLDGLLKADGDEDAEDDGGQMDEEVAACGGGVVRRVDVDHG
jgi:hypothetical protein